jgi:hypothetical protein
LRQCHAKLSLKGATDRFSERQTIIDEQKRKLNGKSMATFAATRFNDSLTVFGTHPGAKTRCSFSFAAGTAESSLSHNRLLQKNFI